MRIALCHHWSLTYLAGGEKFLLDLAGFLQKRGHRISLYCLPVNRRPDRTPFVKAPYHEGWKHSVNADVAYFVYAPLVWHLFRSECPKIAGLHSFMFDPLSSSEILHTISIAKSLYLFGPTFTVADRYFRLAERTELSRFEAIHTVSGLTKYSHPNIFHIPLFVDRSVYKPLAEKGDQFTVLFVGRESWTKGIDIFTQTSSILRGENFRFESVGKAPRNAFFKSLGFAPGIDLVRAYGEAHCVVHPTRADVFALTIVEAMACGTPVITTPLPSHRRLGLPLLYAETVADIVAQLRELRRLWMNRRDDYMKLSQSARMATSIYDIVKIAPMYEKMFESVCRGARLSR